MKSLIRVLVFSLVVVALAACSNEEKNKTVVRSSLEVMKYDKNQLVNDADVIIEGVVISQEVQEDFEGFPSTDTFIKVSKVYKGNPSDTVEIRVKGGETDKMLYIPEEELLPSFKLDEKVIVFLTSNKGSRPDKDDFGYYVVGEYQGKFSGEDSEKRLMNETFTFNPQDFEQELQKIEEENKINKLEKNFYDEGEEADI
ncbi:MAG TPA: hypothetical protein IAA29_11030 [Candidatus Paenibacillus intestinavium]|nr:hypothetical protein [Candidatus Paenibacillus intestinavium]